MAEDVFNSDRREMEWQKENRLKEEAEKQLRINYGMTFSTREGFEVLRDMMDISKFIQSTYVPGDQYASAFNEGMRNLFLYVLAHLSSELKSKLIGG